VNSERLAHLQTLPVLARQRIQIVVISL
jgi:hypothetical protein